MLITFSAKVSSTLVDNHLRKVRIPTCIFHYYIIYFNKMNENKSLLQLLSSQLSYENMKKVEVMGIYQLCLPSNCPRFLSCKLNCLSHLAVDRIKWLHIVKDTLGNVCINSVQFTQSCLTLCNPMDCSTTGLPVHHQLLEFTQTLLHWVGDAIPPSHPLSSPSPPAFNLSQH